MNKLLLYGASGHAKVAIDCARSEAIEVVSIFDDDPEKKLLMNIPVVGKYNNELYPEIPLVITIGNNQIRARISRSIKHSFGRIQHKSSVIASDVTIGEGTVLFHATIIQIGCKIGKHSIINTGSIIDHDCVIGDFSHISPNATICGGVTIKEGTHIGAGAVVIPGVTIGKWATVGAGSVIIKDVDDYAITVGDKGRIIGYNK